MTPRLSTYSAVVALCLALIDPVFASEALDPTAALAQFAPPAEATVYLVASTAIFRATLGEPEMQRGACRYVARDPAAIGALVDLVRKAEPRATPRVGRLDLRVGVYLVTAEGATLDLLLDGIAGNGPVTGLLRQAGSGEVRSIDIAAAPSLPNDLRAWAARVGGTGDGAACGQPH